MNRTRNDNHLRRMIACGCAYGLTAFIFSISIPAEVFASRWSEPSPSNPATKNRTSDLPPTPGLKRLPPVAPEAAPKSVNAVTTPAAIPQAEPIDWRRPSMVMGPHRGRSTPQPSQVRLVSDVSPAAPAVDSPRSSTATNTSELMPAHTTPQNGATAPKTKQVDFAGASASRYSQTSASLAADETSKFLPHYARKAADLANPAEASSAPPIEKPNFARVTDESTAIAAVSSELSPIYVCRLLGLKATDQNPAQ
ncbi:MAG: hypothetical protein ACIALR_03520 [Blastopirellula sp. JB062]